MTAKAPPITEAQFLTQVTQLAEIYGWQWVHFRPARTAHGWRTPVQGPLGKGWPDLVLVHPDRARLLFVELKTDGEKLRPEQAAFFDLLSRTARRGFLFEGGASFEAYVWRPADWPAVEAALR